MKSNSKLGIRHSSSFKPMVKKSSICLNKEQTPNGTIDLTRDVDETKRNVDNVSFEVNVPPSTPASRRISETRKKISVGTGVPKTSIIRNKLSKNIPEVKKETRNKMIPVGKAKNNSSSNSYSTSFQQDSFNNSKNKASSTYSTIVLNESPPKKRSTPQNKIVSTVNRKETDAEANDSNSVVSILRICERIKTLLSSSVKESFNLLNEDSQMNKDKLHLDRVLNKAVLFYEIENIKKETEELHSNLKSINTSHCSMNEASSFESTRMNTNLIEVSSERRMSIYKKFFDICIECLNDLKGNIINYTQMNINYNSNNVNISNNTYNNININPNQPTGSNVNVNLSLNLHTINKMMSKKKLSSKRFAMEDDLDYFDDVNEGFTANVPNHKDCHVKKPKDYNLKFRVYTDGDIDSSDLSRILCFTEDEEEIRNKPDTQHNFKKLMSKSFLNVNKLKIEDNKKRNPIEVIQPQVRLILNDSDSRVIIDSEEEEYDDYDDDVLSKVMLDSNYEDLKRHESVATMKQTKFPRRSFKTPTQILRQSKPIILERKVIRANTVQIPKTTTNKNNKECLIF